MSNHEVVLDTAGAGGWPRLTCYTCDNETCLKAPYMSGLDWPKAVAKFLLDHPPKDDLGMTFDFWFRNSDGWLQRLMVKTDGLTSFSRSQFTQPRLERLEDNGRYRLTFFLTKRRGERIYASADFIDEEHDA